MFDENADASQQHRQPVRAVHEGAKLDEHSGVVQLLAVAVVDELNANVCRLFDAVPLRPDRSSAGV